ncbi:LPXTG cell wall anchor domain-containing protein [Babesia caballi]|uniref:LPXTG cell wall anchor domain-containing protein n=1 Tax=Babesia caballi TaxID=5871 RepID=A0AAV4LQS5_BABCB|nr:LPXTG cell wall anchor domain-containing protein [Babesia caballi]
MAHARQCTRSVPVPNTLKKALEFFDALYNNVGGPQRALVNELGDKIQNDGYAEHITVTLQNVQQSAHDLRFRIIGNRKAQSYEYYETIKSSSAKDQSCVRYIIGMLVYILPRLLNTLKVLEPKVKDFTDNGWAKQQSNGKGTKDELYLWLTESPSNSDMTRLPGGYLKTEVIGGVGNGLHTSASKLVGGANGCLQKLWQRIQQIANNYPPLLAAPPLPTPGPQPHASASPASSAQSQSSWQHNGSPSQDPRSPSPSFQTRGSPPHQPQSPSVEQPPPEKQPSPVGSDSSTVAIGGAVGATGLVGGGAAVYFLNVGGIRTLIAG